MPDRLDDRGRAVVKVRKLLALADRTTFAPEKQVSIAKAQALVIKHRLTRNDIDPPSRPQAPRYGVRPPRGSVVVVIVGSPWGNFSTTGATGNYTTWAAGNG